MHTLQPPTQGKIIDTAEQIPVFLHAISFGLIPRMPLPVLIDVFALLVWIACSTLPIPGAGPLRYLLAGYFLLGLLRFPDQLMSTVVRCWPLFLIPVMCMVSAAWAPFPGDAIRKGVLLALTSFFAVYLSSRLSIRQLIFGYLLIEGVGMVLSYATLNVVYGSATGIFGQKNYLATHMFILYCGALTFFLDKQVRWIVRLPSLMAAVLAAALIYLSHSTTTIAFMIVATGAFLGHAFIWQPARNVPNLRTAIIIGLILLVAMLLYAVVAIGNINLYEEFLAANGKDSTLTGRTYLWDQAWRIIRDNPWSGLGANAFWRPEIGDANSILKYFFYSGFTQFSFHNSYLEIGVQLGYPGMYAMMFAAAWALYRNVRNWFANQTIANAFFLIIAVLVVIRSNTEIDLVIDFGPTMILFYIGAARVSRKPAPAAPPVAAAPGAFSTAPLR